MIDAIEVEPVVPLPTTLSGYTQIEQRLYRLLGSVDITYEPQALFGRYTVDAYLPRYRIALEADGCFWHGCPVCYGEDIFEVTDQEFRRSVRDERLWSRHRVVTLHLWGHHLKDDADALNALLAVLTLWLGR